MKKTIKLFTTIVVLILSMVLLVSCTSKDKTALTQATDNLKVEQLLGGNTSKDAVTKNLSLITKDGDVTITWSSSDKAVITDAGVVTRQDADKVVTLTATLTLNKLSGTKEFEFKVLKKEVVTPEPEPEPKPDPDPEVKNPAVLKYESEDTTKFTEDDTVNNADKVNLDPEMFNVYGSVIDGGSFTNPIGLNKDGTIRLYASRNDGFGNILEVNIKEGFIITKIEFEFGAGNNSPFMGLLTLGTEEVELDGDDISNTTLIKDDLQINRFKIANNQLGGDKSTQIWIKSIKITFEEGEVVVVKHTVEFKDKDGVVLSTSQVEHGKAATAPTPPAVVGHTFKEWDKAFTNVTEDLVVTATYTVNKYTLTWFVNGVSTEVSYDYNAAVVELDTPVKTGHTFKKWDVAIPATMPAENVTITAEFDVNTYTISFVLPNELELEDIELEFGADIELPAAPANGDAVFVGWYTDEELTEEFNSLTMPAENLKLYAYYTEDVIITLDAKGGTVTPTSVVKPALAEVELPLATKEGYNFVGWFIDLEFTTEFDNIVPEEDITLYAKYEIKVYKVTFNDKDGELIEVVDVEHGADAVAPDAPEVLGYSFNGWSLEITNVTDDLTVEATYVLTVYTITYELDGGTNHVDNPVEYTFETAIITLEDATKEYNIFLGWFDAAEEGNKVTKITLGSSGNVKLYARWEELVIYTIKFFGHEGVLIKEEIILDDVLITQIKRPVVVGQDFLGWFTSNTFDTEFDFSVKPNADTNIYGKYVVSRFDYHETFEGSNFTGSSYVDGKYTGVNNTDFNYVKTRGETGFVIDDKGLMLQAASYIEFTIPSGIEDFYFEYRKAHTSIDSRKLEIYINGVKQFTTAEFSTTNIEETEVYIFDNKLHVEESVTIKILNASAGTSGKQLVIDNIKWSNYDKSIETVIVTYEYDGQTTEVNHVKGMAITNLLEVEKVGYDFEGWYLEDTFETPFDQSMIITESITLYGDLSIKLSTIEEVINYSNNTEVMFYGIVTGFTDYVAKYENYDKVFVEDETGAIVIYRAKLPENLKIGDKIKIKGKKVVTSGQIRIAENATFSDITSGHELSDPIVLEDIDGNLNEIMSNRVNLSGFVSSKSAQEITITIGEKEILVRSNSSEPEHPVTAILLSSVIGQEIELTNVHLDWYTNAQLLPTRADQLNLLELSDQRKVEIAISELDELYKDKSFNMGSDIELLEESALGVSISWILNPADAIAEGKWFDVEKDETVNLEAKVKLGLEEEVILYTITILYIDPNVELTSLHVYEGASGTTSYGTTQKINLSIDGVVETQNLELSGQRLAASKTSGASDWMDRNALVLAANSSSDAFVEFNLNGKYLKEITLKMGYWNAAGKTQTTSIVIEGWNGESWIIIKDNFKEEITTAEYTNINVDLDGLEFNLDKFRVYQVGPHSKNDGRVVIDMVTVLVKQ